MNLELIIKLAKLANNNPSDNEANAAARKVCKLIAEGNYAFSNGTRTAQAPIPNPYTPPRPRTWADVKRSSEPEFKSTKQSSYDYYEDMSDLFNELFNRGQHTRSNPNQDPKKDKREYQQTKHDEQYNRNPYTGEKIPKDIPKRPLNCKTCGQQIMTAFVGVPQMFECNKCIWQAYKEKK